jgi:hypothetical protein
MLLTTSHHARADAAWLRRCGEVMGGRPLIAVACGAHPDGAVPAIVLYLCISVLPHECMALTVTQRGKRGEISLYNQSTERQLAQTEASQLPKKTDRGELLV